MKKQTAYLENWTVVRLGDGSLQLRGNVYCHPGFHDGTFIYTSRVRNLNREHKTVETENTFYTLGQPAASVEKYN